ncbi:MAG TPA: efflux RND transporter periplasmic adaptor subunit [Blastocatellia bacterium]|nr:efflux RND transporter periplasmic adaptor subunit [Blastocatellia bacterium]
MMARQEDKALHLDNPPDEEPGTARGRLRERLARVGARAWLLTLASIVVFAFLIYWLWPSKKATAEEEAADILVSVRVAKAERGVISSEVTALGTIFPREQATVSPKINAQIKSMALLKNKAVKAGEVLATLEARDLQAQRAEAASALEEAQANLRLLSGGTIPEATAQDEKALRDARANVANARATYERRRALFERGGISQKDLDASQLALTTAENDLRATEAAARLHQTATNPNHRAAAASRVRQAQDRLAALDTQLSYAVIRAPFAGVVTDQFQYEGEFAAAGAKLLNIADVSEVIVKAPISDTVAVRLKVGDPATVLPQELPDEKIEAKISLISRSSDPQNRTVEIWVNLKNADGRLRANSAAKVAVTTDAATDAIVVPASAVTLKATNADEGTVMVVDEESVARETKVTVGIRNAEQVQITAGLEGGETVVIEGNYALPDGTKVKTEEGGDEEDEKKGGDEGGGASGPAPGGGVPQQGNPSNNGAQPNPNGGTTNPSTAPGSGAGATPTAVPNSKGGAGAKPAAQPGGKP